MVLLCEDSGPGSIGGLCHVLEYSTKKSTRIARSSFAAEILAANKASEAAMRIVDWLREIDEGVEGVREMIGSENFIPVQLVTDAKDVYLAVQCTRPYRGSDQSVGLYVEAIKEDIMQGRVQEVVWVRTADMLVDAMTKNMRDVLLQILMKTGRSDVNESEVYRYVDTYYLRNKSSWDEFNDLHCFVEGYSCNDLFNENVFTSPSMWWLLPVCICMPCQA